MEKKVVLISTSPASAQEGEQGNLFNRELNLIEFASPNEWSFFKYVDNPVGLYHGNPDVSIPLYTIRDGSVEIPIALRYNTSGIRVEEEAGWVGLGWNLNLDGYIVCQIVDGDDYRDDTFESSFENMFYGSSQGNVNTHGSIGFSYDLLGRLTESAMYIDSTYADGNSEKGVTYDRNGNILTLRRYVGSTLSDDMSYTYSGNHRAGYLYDSMGNVTAVPAGGPVSSFNRLNLPDSVSEAGGDTTIYAYLVDGTKVSAINLEGRGYRYRGSLRFAADTGTVTFESTDFPGGRIVGDGRSYRLLHFTTDHIGSVRMITDGSGTVEERYDYLPFGMALDAGTSEPCGSKGDFLFSGKERQDDGRGLLDFGARMYDPSVMIWTSMDPLAEKYPDISPYAYCLNNPVRYTDTDGREIDIEHRTGFLGLGKKETLKYDNGNLYYKDGSAYTGKVNGFLKKTVNALGSLNQTKEGASMVTELQSSSNVFTIKSGATNEFKPDSPSKAGANLTEVQAATGNTTGSTGSGGTMFWNSSSTSGGFDLSGGRTRPAYISLGHEMGHGSDANQGLLHFSSDYTNGVTGVQYQSTFQGLLKSEWRAVYRENLIRGQAGVPLRTNYGIDMSTGTALPAGPRLLDATNQPLNYK